MKASKVQFGLTLLEVALAASFFSSQTLLAKDTEWHPYLLIDSFNMSESMAITQLDGGKGEFHSGGERAFTSNWLEIGVTYRDWSLGALYRYEQSYRYSSDFADFYYAISQENPLTSNRNYQLNLAAERWRGSGLRLAYQFAWTDHHQLQLGASLFNADNLSYGTIDGYANSPTPKTYNYQANVNYRYEQDELFGRTTRQESQGRGYALDLKASGQFNNGVRYQLWLRDALGSIDWGRTLKTTAVATSKVVSYTPDGYLQVAPVLSGREGASNFTQSLSPWINASLSVPLSNHFDAILAYQEHYAYGQKGIGLATKALFDRTSLVIFPEQSLVNLGIEQGHWRFGVASDAINLDEARSFWLTLGYR
ncbi:MAG: hypothetical protein B7X52_05095 [Thiotrichales bacterium 34-46-19]|nr:MAG: hypothetical protein B7Y68_01395 [Thiotrichales bacterium 35-46-9]OZA18131.1 MAG: hypothetical protein B7X85_04160 [Thiotrichales bacterium 17-46-47]OZA96491.1 MAG: hypothetical protein B7X52_05095 [Thiotrichales bacterium 34-46-19]HQT05206.1 hypothetical protein [Thiotrichales bacterium]